MKPEIRIESIQKAKSLPAVITGISSFDLDDLATDGEISVDFPTNLRLGHLVERAVATILRASEDYNVLSEHVQVIDEGVTIGELDFVLEHTSSREVYHVELAYKFYLYDPEISEYMVERWIGPNRNDTLHQKLDKLKTAQFPLLFQEITKARLSGVVTGQVSQRLCLLANLYLPYAIKESIGEEWLPFLRGYYLRMDTWRDIHHDGKTYHLPKKTDWGIDPINAEEWSHPDNVEATIENSLASKRSLLCWQREGSVYLQYFIIWW